MRNEFFLLTVDGAGAMRLLNDPDSGEPKDFRSDAQANSEGRRLLNGAKAVRYKVLKTVSDQS